jgi:hypothetical protein
MYIKGQASLAEGFIDALPVALWLPAKCYQNLSKLLQLGNVPQIH